MKRHITWPRAILAFIALLLFAAWYVPRLNAERYREPIHSALENALQRKVGIGAINFRLLPVPGFTVEDVIVGEDPAVGPEPIAYIKTLRARPTVGSLLGRELAFASVDLEDTSVNLTRVGEGSGVRWNFSALMQPKLLATFPSVHMIGGRMNFKFGDTKSIFYLLNTDVDLWPPDSAAGPWTVKIRAEPARTDRPSRGFATFTARGQWEPQKNTVTLDANLEKSELGDMVTLFEGHESNVHGHISGAAHVAGPANHVGVAGRLAIDEIHGWNQVPPGGRAWPLAISGAIDIPGQGIELRATIAGQRQSPLDLRYAVHNYLRHPEWRVDALFAQQPLAPLVDIARNLGWSVPTDLRVSGAMDGTAAIASGDQAPTLSGEVQLDGVSLTFPNSGALKLARANVQLAGSAIHLAETRVSNDADETAAFDAGWDLATMTGTVSVTSAGMSVVSLRRQAAALSIPLLSQVAGGTWSGTLRYEGAESAWSGKQHFTDAVLNLQAFSEPLRLAAADVTVDADRVSLQKTAFQLGELKGDLDYTYAHAEARPHQFHVTVTSADGEELERLLAPTLHRGGFLNKAFNVGRVPQPAWMQDLHADGTVQILQLTTEPVTFSKLKSRVLWDGEDVRFAPLEAVIKGAVFAGIGSAQLAQREPVYSVSGRIAGYEWRSATLSGEGTLTTSGGGPALVTNMTGAGSFRARKLAPWDSVAGCFELAKNAVAHLTKLVASARGETQLGKGELQNDQITVQIDGEEKPVVLKIK